MIRSRQSCFSATEKDKYPYDEVLMFWCGDTIDAADVLLRQLIPVSSLDAMTNRKEIYLHSIEFAGYDTSESLVEKDKDAEKEFANEMVIGNMLSASWQPNYCRPIVSINGVNITSSISTFNDHPCPSVGVELLGISKSIGLPLPFCLTINRVIKEPKDIEIYGALAQRTLDGYRNYPLLAIVNFWHSFN